MFYLDPGDTKLGLKGSLDKMGTPPDIPLQGEDILAEHCIIHNSEDSEMVMLTPIGPNCQVNGVVVTEKLELHQGTMIVLGMDNMFRFNHPRQASRLRTARESAVDGPNSAIATPNGGSGVFSLGQIFEDKRKAEVARLEATRLKLEEMEAEKAIYAVEQERRLKEQADLELKMKEMEDAIAARAEASEEANATAAAAREVVEARAVEEAARAGKLAEEKAALEEAKRLADEHASKMQAEMAALAEQQRLLQEQAEAARVKTEQLTKQREEDAAAAAADHLQQEQLLLDARAIADKLAAKRLADDAAQLEKEKTATEEQRKINAAAEEALQAARKEKADMELAAKVKDAELDALKQQGQTTKDAVEAERAALEAKAAAIQEKEARRKADEVEHRRKVKRLEMMTGHADRVHSLARSHTSAFSGRTEKSDFEVTWGVRIPRYHDRTEGGKSHIVFELRIACRGEEWTVFRRYSQFETLHKRLQKTLPGPMANATFPGKKLWGKADAQYLQERKLGLETYLRIAIEMTHNLPNSPFYKTSKRELEKNLPFFRSDGPASGF